MITLINYGLGNISAFATIYRHLNIEYKIASTPKDLRGATRLILPGVGAFDWAIDKLNSSGLRWTLDELVLETKVPILGVCVGMQMLADSSEEGSRPGLGWIPGNVKRIDISTLKSGTHLPHMGWNDVTRVTANSLFDKLSESAKFYFLHSYHFDVSDSTNILAKSYYGQEFACAVSKENIYGTQFHPEKSHQWGITLLRNFALMEN